ncbi:FAD-dependent oxidoreductase [Cellulomonas hominis]|uniref:FAD-dependent oxidoreductase n=1 Tax=Cellulomonas hominis TaxID=156981 RepID=UPI001443B34A|nr:FAD-dependent oxidoreductase [Cellulomonas hominis]NKY12155.1 NAD(P)-binding domain-containing protein [Cellulomonas hominis]
MSQFPAPSLDSLPVVVIGAGPVGLAAAAHLLERGLDPLVLEAGPAVGAAVREWAHIRLFSPWEYDVDAAARRLLEPTGWVAPAGVRLPTGGDLVADYLEPLAATPQLRDRILTGARVVAVSRIGLDKTHGVGREERPFLVRTVVDGRVVDHHARAVLDASGTWSQHNPLGVAGLPAPGEDEAAPFLLGPLPDVLGTDRDRVAGRHVLVVGAGHSATNTLLNLVELADLEPGARITWAVRGASVTRTYGGGDADGLPARGQLGSSLREAVEAGKIGLLTSTTITGFENAGDRVTVTLDTAAGRRELTVDAVAGATGFRPDLSMLRELRLDLDPGLEAPRALAPLIDPQFHSCGTVPAHGAETLAQPEPGFFVVGMKSYGRAPTFLLATGYEQVRSIAAHLAGDEQAARELKLDLPETGVCSTSLPVLDADGTALVDPAGGGCCGPAPEPALIGFPTGLLHGRSGE